MDTSIIELSGLTKKYGDVVVVDDLNLSIKKGEIFGLLGPNGAGKSTTIRMILGMSEPSSGFVNVFGLSSTTRPIDVKRKVGYLPEDVGFYDNMTGLENLMFTSRLNQIPESEGKRRALELLDIVGLSDHIEKKTGLYSRGMRQRLGLADSLIKNPEAIILDEPTLGIDPKGIKDFLDLIVRLSRERGITVLFSSHHLHQVQQVCDRVGIFVKGKLIATGDLQGLSKKLFSSSPFIFEVFAKPDRTSDNDGALNSLSQRLSNLSHVKQVKGNGSMYTIDCEKDVAPLIAKTIVESNFHLHSLTKKEYGLDDIYYRYFEGGDNHE